MPGLVCPPDTEGKRSLLAWGKDTDECPDIRLMHGGPRRTPMVVITVRGMEGRKGKVISTCMQENGSTQVKKICEEGKINWIRKENGNCIKGERRHSAEKYDERDSFPLLRKGAWKNWLVQGKEAHCAVGVKGRHPHQTIRQCKKGIFWIIYLLISRIFLSCYEVS